MKKLFFYFLLLLLLLVSGCSNSHSTSDDRNNDDEITVNNSDQNTVPQQNHGNSSPNWVSSFSSQTLDEDSSQPIDSNNPFFFIDESYTMKEIIRLYDPDIDNIYASDAEYHPSIQCGMVDLFGVRGSLSFTFWYTSENPEEYEQKIESVIFRYSYPSLDTYRQDLETYWQDLEAYRQNPQGDEPVMPDFEDMEPSVEDMQAAQSFMTSVVSSFSKIYGEPAFSKPGQYVWNLSDDFFQRYIGVYKEDADEITGSVVVRYIIDDWDGKHYTFGGEEIE